MNIKEIQNCITEVINECRSLNIPVSGQIDENIDINRRAKGRFACCKKQVKGTNVKFVIEIGEALMNVSSDLVKGILAHEVLHTCPGCYNHGTKWKQYAAKMNRVFGYDIKTTSTYEELGLKRPESKKKVNYKIICQDCGNTIFRQRKSQLVTQTNRYRCSCGGKLRCYKI